MKKAIIALDGGGSNLRMLVADQDTDEQIYYKEINSGTNLSSVPNKEEALNNIKSLIEDGYLHIPREYILQGIGLSSAGTEIKENKESLEQAINEVIETLKIASSRVTKYPPASYVTNDIDILLHSADIALVAGTGTVGAVKFMDVQPYDNTDEAPSEYTIRKFDGNGQFIGDKGSGFWIAKEVLTRVSEIEDLGGYVNSKGEFVEVDPEDSILREMVLKKLFNTTDISEGTQQKALLTSLRRADLPEFVSMVYDATQADGKPFDRAKVGNMFSKIADDAAIYGDEAANDILKQASIELFKNIRASYEKGNFADDQLYTLLLSGSVLVHSKIVRSFLETVVKEKYPNLVIKVNNEEPVWLTERYVKDKLEKSKNIDNQNNSSEVSTEAKTIDDGEER